MVIKKQFSSHLTKLGAVRGEKVQLKSVETVAFVTKMEINDISLSILKEQLITIFFWQHRVVIRTKKFNAVGLVGLNPRPVKGVCESPGKRNYGKKFLH